MIDLRFVPLDLAAFPGGARPDAKRRASSVFKSKYERTLDRLEHELGLLKAFDVVIQAGYKLVDIRNDGWPRSSAAPAHPGVVLSFRSKSSGSEYSFPCDTFTRFEHNLHAIAFTLEALRAVNRYGVTRGHEQYRGFAQIEAAPDPKKWSVDDAAAWLAERLAWNPVERAMILTHPAFYREGYRVMARTCHPDTGGPAAREEWDRLQAARKLLDAHHGLGAGA